MFKKFLTSFLEILFPPLCLGCKKYLSSQVPQRGIWEGEFLHNEKELLLCARCYEAIEIHNSFFCPKCNRRLPPTVIVNSHSHSRFILAAASSYQNKIVREIIHSLKYDRIAAAIKPISKIMEKYLQKIICNLAILQSCNYFIIPIPLHSQKLRERGFNQAELIAKELVIKLATKLATYDVANLRTETDNLIRLKKTKSQTKLKKEERTANIENCFALKNPSEISGKNIILVDDVFTSGATMREAVKILKAAGAKKIVGFVVAKT